MSTSLKNKVLLEPLRPSLNYRRIVLLTEGFSKPEYAKTAISLLRYRKNDVIAVLDGGVTNQTTFDLFGVGEGVPIVSSLDGLMADALFLGTSIAGGKLPAAWKSIILNALSQGIDVISGNHEFLINDPDFVAASELNNCKLIDVRRNNECSISTGEPLSNSCFRVHTVGQDCSLGKMVVSFEVQQELAKRGNDAKFIATGQTGIMISGDGIPVDCVVSDFINGAVEALIRRNEEHDILLIEGQGSISHPSYSAVTMGLLHGCAPHALIYCYEVGRNKVKGLDKITLLPHRMMMDAYVVNASLRNSTKIVGIAMNSRNVTVGQAEDERQRMQEEFNLPVCDVYRDGAGALANAVLDYREEFYS